MSKVEIQLLPPSLTSAERERLALLAEECGELVQIIGKTLRHGYESYNPFDKAGGANRERIEREVGDVFTAATIMFDAGDIRRLAVASREEQKRESVQQYLHYNVVRRR